MVDGDRGIQIQMQPPIMIRGRTAAHAGAWACVRVAQIAGSDQRRWLINQSPQCRRRGDRPEHVLGIPQLSDPSTLSAPSATAAT